MLIRLKLESDPNFYDRYFYSCQRLMYKRLRLISFIFQTQPCLPSA